MTGSIAMALLGLYLLIGEPLLGRWSYRRMLAALDPGTPGVRRRFYLQWTWQAWAVAAVTLAVSLGLAGWAPAQLGLRLPDWPHLDGAGFGASASLVKGVLIGAGVAFAASLIVAIVLAGRRRSAGSNSGGAGHRRQRVAGNRDLIRMLPQTPGERRAFAALAVTAGITEEVIWRGFGLTLLFALLPSLHPAVPIALAAVAFGWAHVYQGYAGMLATGMIGAILALLFWASGSLLWPMLVHVLRDLRVLLVREPAHATPGDPS